MPGGGESVQDVATRVLPCVTTLIARHARTVVMHLTNRSPWTPIITDAITRLQTLPAPAG